MYERPSFSKVLSFAESMKSAECAAKAEASSHFAEVSFTTSVTSVNSSSLSLTDAE